MVNIPQGQKYLMRCSVLENDIVLFLALVQAHSKNSCYALDVAFVTIKVTERRCHNQPNFLSLPHAPLCIPS